MIDNQTSGGITIHVGPAKLQMLQLAGAALSDTPTESMLDDRIAELEDENAALQQENAALRADKERLDWLETLDCDSPWWVHLADSTNLRAAIDAVSKEEQP